MYPREQYLKEIISKKDNGRIKIITGLRRSGKSVSAVSGMASGRRGEGRPDHRFGFGHIGKCQIS